MNGNPWMVYDLILDTVHDGVSIDHLCLGLTWTCCRTAHGTGFAQSPGSASRVLSFPGTVAGRGTREVAAWLKSWDPFEATVGLAAANATINTSANRLMMHATRLTGAAPANLAVFEYFRPRLERRKVVIIGRYPGLDTVLEGLDVTVLERQPGNGDLPDPAAEYLLPQADWVFMTATTLINKTFPRLSELAAEAVTVLMGPSTPWLDGFADHGIDFLAGVVPVDIGKAFTIASEGGGTRLFGEGVTYAVADVGAARLAGLKAEIAGTAAKRAALQQAMSAWYEKDKCVRFPEYAELERLTATLSRLDLAYKRQWDARNMPRLHRRCFPVLDQWQSIDPTRKSPL
jgi:uncharacterized protein